jgi:trimeric autotransporter adhesin
VTLTATSAADPTKSASAGITIVDVPGISVTISPSDVTLSPRGTQVFTAVVNDPSNSGVTWRLSGFPCALGSLSACGSFSERTPTATGETILYTAPNFSGTLPDGLNLITVTVFSSIDQSKGGLATIALVD